MHADMQEVDPRSQSVEESQDILYLLLCLSPFTSLKFYTLNLFGDIGELVYVCFRPTECPRRSADLKAPFPSTSPTQCSPVLPAPVLYLNGFSGKDNYLPNLSASFPSL